MFFGAMLDVLLMVLLAVVFFGYTSAYHSQRVSKD